MAWVTDMGIDLGTATVLVYLRGKGIVLNEPSVVAIEQQTKKVLAVGERAQQMLGRTPGNIIAIRPLREGVIADFDVTEIMLKHFIFEACRRRHLLRPRVVVCIPVGTTSVEKKAVIEAVTRTGAKEAYLIEEPRAAALGAGLDIFEPSGNMVVDIGGGTTDIAVLSMGETVVSCSVRVGGDKFDEAITRYLKREYNLLIGERSAEALKIQIGSAFPGNRSLKMEIRGRDLVNGLPRSLEVTTEHIAVAISDPLWIIIQGVRHVLERTPPELAGDIIDKGIILTGGGSLLDGLYKIIAQQTGVPAYLAEDPIGSVAKGTGKVLEYLDRLSPTLITTRSMFAAVNHLV
ncbi:MAG: MreB/Mrl family cell shape determining protein [Dethiobacter sp.]|jgi:rod shape-determining protein MreB|nr:MAG: MreB/Mrl family cell shape determining protein [Dethiobacter sp.]